MIEYQRSGSGENSLVFVHGLTCDHSDWDLQVEAFAADYQCLAVDLRGHGASATMSGPLDIETHASDVVQLLCSLDIKNAVLIGHSMGTRVIASACIQAPERVGGLLFVDGSQQGRGDPWHAGDAIANGLANDDDVRAFASKLFSMMFTGRCDTSLKKRVLQRAAEMPAERLREQLRLMMMWDAGRFSAVVSQIGVPLYLLQSTWVDADRNRHTIEQGATTEYLDQVRQLVPDANIEVVADCGHFTQFDAVGETNRTIAALGNAVFG